VNDDDQWDPTEAELEEAAAADMTVEEWRACTAPDLLTMDEIGDLQDEYDL
jgi:hypothetical protein